MRGDELTIIFMSKKCLIIFAPSLIQAKPVCNYLVTDDCLMSSIQILQTFEIKGFMYNTIKFSRETITKKARSHQNGRRLARPAISKPPQSREYGKQQETLTRCYRKEKGKNRVQPEEEGEDPTFAVAESSPAAGVKEGGGSGELAVEGGLERHRRRRALLVRSPETMAVERDREMCGQGRGGEGR